MRQTWVRGEFATEKLLIHVEFDDHLVLESRRYSLRGVVQHEGLQSFAGHYTCHVRLSGNSWAFCNDFAPPVAVPFALVRNAQAYILVYELQPGQV
eukprot:9822469-Karenia_brevis.AAC.1